MSQAAIVLWVIGFVVFTVNVFCICDTIEQVAELKYGKKKDPEEEKIKDLEEKLLKSQFQIIHND